MTFPETCQFCGHPASTLIPACIECGSRDRVEGFHGVRGLLGGVILALIVFGLALVAVLAWWSR